MEDIAALAVDHARKLGAEFSDIRVEHASGTSIVVMDGRTKSMTSQQESGCGLRAFVSGSWGFATTNSLTKVSVKSVAEAAVRMALASRSRVKHKFSIPVGKAVRAKEIYGCKELPSSIPIEDKLAFCLDNDGSMTKFDSRVTSTNTRYYDLEVDRTVANSFGTLVTTKERWTLGSCSAFARSEGVVQHGHASFGSVGGFELMRKDEAHSLGGDAASQALRLLDSKPVPAGKTTCIFDNKMTGMLAHEAFGHACEADGILAGASVLEGMVGKRVAVEDVSLFDDPTVKNTFGYFSIDWEGVRAKKHTLIENGILRGFMHNIESGSRMDTQSNGSARSQAYNSPPIIRMSNTYVGPGDWSKDELIEDTKHGLLIKGSQYGYVEPAKGQFMFKCDEAYEINGGEVGQRYRDASISGLIMEVLNNVNGLADDFILTDPGYCGKSGQSARTTDGGPHMRVTNMVIGGIV